MDKTTSSRPCPFCGRDFASLGNHLRHCPDRHGREYDHLLSHKTLSKKSTKKQKETCIKCGGRFNRLDTHLRTSASCKDIPAQMPKVKATNSPASKFPVTEPLSELPTTEPISELPTTEPISELPAIEPTSELPTTESISELPTTEPISELLPVEPKDHTTSQAALVAPAPSHQAHPLPEHYPSPVDLLPVIGLPKEAGKWKEADSFFKVHLVPRMCMEGTVDGMNDVLCKGIYDYFARKSQSNIPTHQKPNHHHQQSHHHHQHPSKAHGQHQRTLKAVKEEKRQAKKKQLRALRRDGTKSEEVRALAHTFHRLVQRYSKLCQEEKRRERRRSRQCERRDCHKNSGGIPNLSSMKTVTPVYRLHSPVKLLRPSLHPPTATPTQTSHSISLPGCLMFHCPILPSLRKRSLKKSYIKSSRSARPLQPPALLTRCTTAYSRIAHPSCQHCSICSTPAGPLHRCHHSGRLESYTFLASRLLSWIPVCPATSDPLP